MKLRLRFPRLTPFLAGAAAVVLLPMTSIPVMAEYTRHCDAEVRIVPQNASQTYLVYSFSVHKTVDHYAQVNQARRDAWAQIVSCLRDHWDEREGDTSPRRCTNQYRTEFHGYPFGSLKDEMTRAMCNANLGVPNMTVGVELYITGDTGCTLGGSQDPIMIGQNERIVCMQPSMEPRSGDGDEPGAGGVADDEAAEPPPIGDGGGSEPVDRVEDEPPADEGTDAGTDEGAVEDDALPAAATYLPLPNTRLPGNDLYLIELDAPNWMLCRQACTEDERCGAWTYRKPNAGSGPICLIKSRAGLPVPDTCCRSGVKQ